jgi:hypothetical protein
MTDKVDESDAESDTFSDTGSQLDLKTNPSCLPEMEVRERISSKRTKASTGFRTIIMRVPVHNKKFLTKPAPVIRGDLDYLTPMGQRINKTADDLTNMGKRTNNTADDLTNEGKRLNSTVDSTMKMNMTSISLMLLLGSIFYFSYGYITDPFSGTCDMKKAENRDFNRFYGIQDLRNHFTTTAADACDSDIIFKSVLPQAVLKPDHSASSFMILAKYGTGKTALRCEYFKSLNSTSYLKVLILNKQINEYLERFVSGTSTDGRDCDSRNCLVGWSKNEFAQLILSVLVTQFVDEFQSGTFELVDSSLDEKVELISILCYYYNGQGVSKLEKLVNLLLKKPINALYSARNAGKHIMEQNQAVDKPVLTHFKKDLNKFSVLRKDHDKLHLLLAVAEGEGFQHESMKKTMFGQIFRDLTHFTVFMKTYLKKLVVFVIDGIDENRYFFKEDVVNKISLELFLRSSVSQEILSSVMAHNFHLSLFYPQIDGINVQDAIIRNDKFPTYTIQWNIKSLINYADYLVQKFKKGSLSAAGCKSFTDFETLVNYRDEKVAAIIDRIATPRQLHYFIIDLISEMNNCAKDVAEPFIATFANVKAAFEKSTKHIPERHRIKD